MQNNRFFIEEITADGSPTLRVKSHTDHELSEQMHHSAGAASETVYIYGEAIQLALKNKLAEDCTFLDVGLGLGYIETLIALMTEFKFKSIASFESEEKLVSHFLDSFERNDSISVYQKVLSHLGKHLNIETNWNLFASFFLDKVNSSTVSFYGDVQSLPTLPFKYNVICYDAFSNHTDSSLWGDQFLDHFIDKYCADECVFASYAKTGSLTRALKNKGFIVLDKKGFAGKRESTLAVRNIKT